MIPYLLIEYTSVAFISRHRIGNAYASFLPFVYFFIKKKYAYPNLNFWIQALTVATIGRIIVGTWCEKSGSRWAVAREFILGRRIASSCDLRLLNCAFSNGSVPDSEVFLFSCCPRTGLLYSRSFGDHLGDSPVVVLGFFYPRFCDYVSATYTSRSG